MKNGTFLTVIVLTGQTGSGKTTLARMLAQQIGASIASFGSFVRSEAIRRGVAGERPSLQNLGQSLLDEFGPIDFTKKVLDSKEGDNDSVIILDGVRNVEVWRAVQTLAFRSVLIYLDIGQSKRIDRLIRRDNLDISVVQLVMQHQMEATIPELKLYANLTLDDSPIGIMVSEVMKMLMRRGIRQ